MKALLCTLPLLLSASLAAAPLSHYQDSWAEIKYQVAEKQQEDAFAALREQVQAELKAHPDDPGYLIWSAIISASYAGAKGGIGALKYVKEAKAELEQSLKLDDKALGGSAYTSLGSLYYQVPGWPIGFGDDDKAEENLKKALAINPDGIDPNFFYGDFLLEERRYQEALQYLTKALAAPDRPGRALADAGRRAEIKDKLAKVNAKLEKRKKK
ncbi:tetratricopeptide repeat protein [Gallaecimonas xiamenensis]|uniref:Uncharacterized protein n=1 Tax=Gallaecimonas xiamenensis 3-C-1 TaxID=745411 RepID=K2JI71_9GAMM|nr:hypothetical protein [Gallaecimonas xiamenensis]EKE74923.1 hypothetical protein B3C1_08546 [Gallaecimonas xiamenensis 3-C-1]